MEICKERSNHERIVLTSGICCLAVGASQKESHKAGSLLYDVLFVVSILLSAPPQRPPIYRKACSAWGREHVCCPLE